MDISNNLLIFMVFIRITFSSQALDDFSWDGNCPTDCDCQLIEESQTSISRWKQDENSSVKVVFCTLRKESLESLLILPDDIESLTLLHANHDNTSLTIGHDILNRFQKAKSFDIQGSLSQSSLFITNDAFHGVVGLKYLSLQRVDISGAEKAFSKLSSLEVLYVIHCEIGYLKWEMLDGLKNLKELYLVQSGIKELYGFAFYGTPELRRLFLSHNDLFSVEADAFVGLLKLEHLDLSNNRIDHLSGLTFPPLPHLQWLELKHNPIKVIFPHCFQFLNGTQHLTLGHKRQPVHLMKFSFRGLYSLLFLHIPNIDNDALFEHMFYDLRSLSHLNLRGRIKLINNRAFNGAHKVLKKLELQDCKIERVFDQSFYGLEHLEFLDVSHNLLRSLPSGIFEPLKMVQRIKLNNNQLKQIPDDLFFLPSINALSLYDNPWNCSCHMTHWREDGVLLHEELKDGSCNSTKCLEELEQDSEIDYNPRCEEPKEFKGETVFNALKQIKCESETHQ